MKLGGKLNNSRKSNDRNAKRYKISPLELSKLCCYNAERQNIRVESNGKHLDLTWIVLSSNVNLLPAHIRIDR